MACAALLVSDVTFPPSLLHAHTHTHILLYSVLKMSSPSLHASTAELCKKWFTSTATLERYATVTSFRLLGFLYLAASGREMEAIAMDACIRRSTGIPAAPPLPSSSSANIIQQRPKKKKKYKQSVKSEEEEELMARHANEMDRKERADKDKALGNGGSALNADEQHALQSLLSVAGENLRKSLPAYWHQLRSAFDVEGEE